MSPIAPDSELLRTEPGAPHTEAPLFDILATVPTILAHWRVVIGVPSALLIAALVFVLFRTPKYVATTSFLQSTKTTPGLPSGISGLANQFGLSTTNLTQESPQLYADLARTREVLNELLQSRYLRSRGDSIVLLQEVVPKNLDSDRRLYRGEQRLRDATSILANQRTGVVQISVSADDPVLAAGIANRYVEALNRFNLERRRTQEGERRRFLEGRTLDALRDLRSAEDELKGFLLHNRSFQDSPQLQFEKGRLGRRVSMAQELYTMLDRNYENARIEEINDTPLITVVERAVPPVYRSRGDDVLLVALVGLISVVGVACYVSIITWYSETSRRQPERLEAIDKLVRSGGLRRAEPR